MTKIHSADHSNLKFIDVVIPAYNARDVIQKSINSCLLQELPENWHQNVIIVNDGSSDDTAMFCKSMFGEQVQIISHEHNRGQIGRAHV